MTHSAQSLAGQRVLITGAAGGIGRATVAAFAAAGARVAASDLMPPDLADAELRLAHDVTREEDWQRALECVGKAFGGLDVLVNNAGVALVKDIEATSLAEWRRVLQVNLEGCFLGTQQGIAAMKEGGGAIVNLASIAGQVAAPLLAAYSTSKAGVAALGRVAAIHCTDRGYPIRINTVKPGFTDTAMLDSIAEALGDEARDPAVIRSKLARHQPMGRLATAEEIAEAILFLASPRASYMTGAELVLDGGFTAR